MSDLRVGDHVQHTVNHAESCAEDWNDCKLLAGDALDLCLGNRGFDFNLLKRQVAGDLVAHELRYFGDQLTKFLGACVLFTHNGKLVLNEGMVEYSYLAHKKSPFLENVYFPKTLS